MMEMPILGPHGSVVDLLARAGRAQHDAFPWKERLDEPIIHDLYWVWMHPLLTIYFAVILPVAILVTR